MTRSEAAEKIRKMMNRNGRTEAEADTASILAAALAEKHGIDIAELDQADSDRTQAITHKGIASWLKVPAEADYAAAICKRFFEVDPLTRSGWTEELNFIGTPLHIEIAEYIFWFLLKEFRWQWNKRRGRSRNRKVFIYGCFCALSMKLRERFEPEEKPGQLLFDLAISLKARRAAYMKEHFPNTTSSQLAPKASAGAALHNGIRAGQDIEIRSGLNGSPAKGRPALTMPNGRLLN